MDSGYSNLQYSAYSSHVKVAPPVPPYADTQTLDAAPPKYIIIDGVRQINPGYLDYQQAHGNNAVSSLKRDQTLPVVCNLEQFSQLQTVSKNVLAPSVTSTIEMMKEPDVCNRVGLSSEGILKGLGKVFAKHEIPMGLMNKYMILGDFHELEFRIDDSGSMGQDSDTKNIHGKTQTRWQEAQSRLKVILEIIAYVPTPKITICFLNRKDTITLQRKGETPEKFLENAYREIDKAFKVDPDGSTPILKKMKESFENGKGKHVARYLFCDGEPDEKKKFISDLVVERFKPQGNPLSLLSCTNDDKQVKWMKELEEVADFCSESDDYDDEAEEVLTDQGEAFPYTRGFHLSIEILGAMYPEDLDAMDESVPFTKWTLDNLLGVMTNDKEYRTYFDSFKEAQRKRPIEGKMDEIKSQQNWEPHFHSFMTEKKSASIQAVKEFKEKLKKAALSK